MKSKLKQQRAITLVALIITIIVLLILAMVSIRLVMNGGIIDRANRGVKIYKDSEIEEKIKLAYSEYQTAKYQTPITLETALEHSGLTGASVSGSDSTEWKVTYNGKVYPIEANGSVGEATEVGKVKYGDQILGIGDQVNYDPTLNAIGSTTYTSLAANSGSDNDQSFDAATYNNSGFKWRVLDVKNGKIRLISDTDVGPGDYSKNATLYYLKGKAGCKNKINELNAICSIFGHGKGAESAASITVEDLTNITGYIPDSSKYAQGEWREYGNKVTYTRGENGNLSAVATNGLTWNGNQSVFKYYNGTSFEDLIGSREITSTVYSKNYSDDANKVGILNEEGTFCIPYEMLFGKYQYDASNNYNRTFIGTREHIYWLASESILVGNDGAYWGIFYIYGTNFGSRRLYNSYDSEYGDDYGVRPIVTLKSDVNIKWNATTNEWQIQ